METEQLSQTNPYTYRDLSPQQFKAYSQQAIDWIAAYLSGMEGISVLAKTPPGALTKKLPKSPPELPESMQQVLMDFERLVIPGITHWNHPRFFAYFSITGSAPGIIGELLASALNINAMLWKTSPAATELEETVLDWLRQMLSLPSTFEGVINDTASVSSLCALAAAREATGLKIRELGLSGRPELPRLSCYTSTEAHSSIEKAAIVLGFGQSGLKKIPVNPHFQMDATALRQAIEADLKQSIKPVAVVATLGTTSTTSMDPVAEIAAICKEFNLWLHVDAAYGGAAAILPEKQPLFTGWEQANSIVVNPHKWLFTPIDCSVLYCRQPAILRQAFSLVPEYLKTSEGDEVKNLMDYGVSLGRRFRSLKLWFVIRTLGQSGLQSAIGEHIEFAQKLKKLLEAHPDFELLAPVPFSTLVFRFIPKQSEFSDESQLTKLNQKLLECINQTGQVFLSHTVLNGKYGIRLAIGNLKTSWDDISFSWELIQNQARKLLQNPEE